MQGPASLARHGQPSVRLAFKRECSAVQPAAELVGIAQSGPVKPER